MIQVVWEENARNRHEEWAFNIALEFTLKHAKSYLNDIANALENIAKHPHLGAEHPTSSRPNLRHLITGGGYSVFYFLDKENNPTRGTVVSVVRGAS